MAELLFLTAFPLLLHSFTSLINNCLKLVFGTQGRSRRLKPFPEKRSGGGEFPGGPVVRTLRFPCTGHGGFFVFFFNVTIHLLFILFMAVLGLCFCARAFSSYGKWGPLLIAVRGPVTIAASLVVEHKLQTRRLSNCGSWA